MCVGTLVCDTLDTCPVGKFKYCCWRLDYRVIVVLGTLVCVPSVHYPRMTLVAGSNALAVLAPSLFTPLSDQSLLTRSH